MKKLGLAFIILATIATSAMAQQHIKIDGYNDQEINTVFKQNKRDGLYFSLSSGYSPINGDNGAVFSTRGCWIMDHWFAFGLVGTGFANNLENMDNYYYNSSNSDEINLVGGYGGFVVEPYLFPLKPVHISFPIVCGVGAVAAIDNYYYDQLYNDDFDVFYAIEPGVELEVNFTKWMRIAAFATYRYTSDIDIEKVSTDALRNYSCGLTVKIGLF